MNLAKREGAVLFQWEGEGILQHFPAWQIDKSELVLQTSETFAASGTWEVYIEVPCSIWGIISMLAEVGTPTGKTTEPCLLGSG